MNQGREFSLGSALFQNVFGMIRMIVFFAILIVFASWFSGEFHQISLRDLIDHLQESMPMFKSFPLSWTAWFFAMLFNPLVFRYMFPPILAFLLVLFAGAFYVMDIYDLKTFRGAMRYVMGSMFASDYPVLTIDNAKGKKPEPGAISPREDNLIEKIGGPGAVLVEPGSGAIFRHLRGRSVWRVAETHFLAPFETIAQTVDLNDQQCDKDGVTCVTRDGIQVKLRDVHFRYRIRMKQENGAPAVRSIRSPYPFDNQSLTRLAFNLQVQDNGKEEPWSAAVERAVTGQITDFVAEHTIDYLTAPRTQAWNPREELCRYLFETARRPLETLGAELIWADVGHLEIVDDRVDDQRTNLWAAPWMGDAAATRAYGDAIRQSYQEMGRAEAQAEMIIGISNALSGLGPGAQSPESIRRLLLARTAQMLEAMHDNTREKQRHENE